MASKLSKLGWYWHRLRAMEPREIALRLQKKAYQRSDAKYENSFDGKLEPGGVFPALPAKEKAPPELIAGLRASVDEILRGEWRAFGHLPLRVDDPPKWQSDYLVNRDFQSSRSAFKLDHRAQPGGADIKVIWEPSRWNQLVRLAMGAWLLGDLKAREKCIEWLLDWAKGNKAFTGLNWTSGLETGIRLIQFAWIDSLLAAAGAPHKTLEELRRQILPPHVWYTWRYRSFGSSANNHLIGELAGIIVALARWPELAGISCALAEVAGIWEKEVLAQFAEDGGNKEQAIGYHLFSFEFCWQARRAIEDAGLKVSTEVKERLRRAGELYASIKPEGDPWDFGDGDNAWVTPLFAHEREFATEWWRWLRGSGASPALQFWWGEFEPRTFRPKGKWQVFESSGIAVLESGDWFVRFDFSPLGYLSMAPHGHLDALHVSVWHRGKAVIIDPGTGAYYADKAARDYLADWTSHNSPQLKTAPESFPRRRGTFLWSQQHGAPRFEMRENSIRAELALPWGKASRTVAIDAVMNCIRICDEVSRSGNSPVVTRWKFAPDLRIAQTTQGTFKLAGGVESFTLECSDAWRMARRYNPPEEERGRIVSTSTALGNVPLECVISPAFRAFACAPYLTLESSEPGPFQLTISAG